MSVSSSFNRPQSLRLSIDTPALRDYVTATYSPLTSSARREPWSYESPSGECYERICTVICLYDFSSSDQDHLSFRRNEVLDIVKQEESGWWAAVRSDGSEVGWVPASYVHILSDHGVEMPYTALEKTRIPEYRADQESVRSAPVFSTRSGDSPSSPGATFSDNGTNQNTEFDSPSPASSSWSNPPSATGKSHDIPATGDGLQVPPPNPAPRETENVLADSSFALLSISPSTRLPLRLDKSLPASPAPTTPSSDIESKFGGLGRSSSGGAIDRSRRRRPVLLDDQSSLLRLSTIIRAQSSDQLSDLVGPPKTPPPPSPSAPTFLPYAHPRPGKVLQLTGDDSAQAFHNAKQAQANLPWYLKHQHGEEEIKLEFDGTVKAGTLPALVERLVVDPLRVSQQEMFRRAFLVTFRTFATSTEVFDLLVGQYELEVPQNLGEEEFDLWRREKLRPTQKRVLTVLTMWLEEYDLLNQDPEVAPKLQDFLSLIISPSSLALTAKHMLKSLERLTFAEPVALEAIIMPLKKWRKMRKGDTHELVRVDPMDLAQHLSLFESTLYRNIRAQECFLWSKTKEGETIKNIQAFCATHDRLADWVKCSILEVDALGKRANMLDFWIRVAEKCRFLNNFSSMSSIVAALSSVLITRLHFTWLNSSRESSLEPLRKVIHPASNYGYYRGILEAIEGPCVPFVGPFLKNIVYAQEQHADNVVVQSGTRPDRQFTLIHFVKRQKWYEITLQMLRFQAKPYLIPEIPEMTNFITSQMTRAVAKGERWYWQRSDELQRAELVHADIKKGLEAAGF
ncbi:ras GEF [Lactarius deliciosus]|nr:ras GEF [Lactarius deliciosus]